jgi:pimeloyl-ACP methyl ester carboxylesterase
MNINSNKKEAVTLTHRQSDGYESHYRFWGPDKGEDIIIILHGGISHSEWQTPLAQAIVSMSDISFAALDRRGSGLNHKMRGHLISANREIEDIISFVNHLRSHFTRVHLAGWCFGGQIASIVASKVAKHGIINSLIMITPGFIFNERYSDVLRLSMQTVFEAVEQLGVKPEKDNPYIPVPLQDIDFTSNQYWLNYISNDKLRLKRVTQNTVLVWNELAELSRNGALSKVDGIPVLTVLGSDDRLVDNYKVKALLEQEIRKPAPKIVLMEAPHAIQFECPENLAKIILDFI